MSKLTRVFILVAVCAAIWFAPHPSAIEPRGWHLLAVFVTTILGFILKPFPIGSIAFFAFTFSILTNTLKLDEALGTFGNSSIWLIVCAFVFARGITKSGLGNRIAFLLIRSFGTSSLKLAYTISCTELILAPFTPSNTARGGGIVFPIVRSLCKVFDSEPDTSPRKLGAYLMIMAHTANLSSSVIFLTATAANPLILSLAKPLLNVDISWWTWFEIASIPGLICLFFFPYFLYKIYPPELKETPEAPAFAQRHLAEMGPMTRQEKIVAFIFLGCLLLWSTSSITGFAATSVAMIGVSALLLANVLNWQDVLEEKSAWDVLFWMSFTVGAAGLLAKFGIIKAFVEAAKSFLGTGLDWHLSFVFVAILYCFSAYFFASGTARVTALFSAFAAIMVSLGAPALYTTMMFGMLGGVGAALTHYGSAVTPIYFNPGFVPQGTWWKIGFVVAVLVFTIIGGVGSIWMSLLGYV